MSKDQDRLPVLTVVPGIIMPVRVQVPSSSNLSFKKKLTGMGAMICI